LIETETLIVGAGPVGLFAIFELGLLGIQAEVVESLDHAGGQCAVLYPEKPIYDIPAVPVVTGEDLVKRLLEQVKPFDPSIHLGQEVRTLERRDDGKFLATTSGGLEIEAGSVIVAGGVGSFQPRPLRVPQAGTLEGHSLHYSVTDKEQFRGQKVAIFGGGDSALDWAVDLMDLADEVTVIHRRDEFRAAPATLARFQRYVASEPNRARIRVGKLESVESTDTIVHSVTVQPFDNSDAEQIACDSLLVFYGLKPNLGPIGEWGLDLKGRNIKVNPVSMATNIPGLFAIGDIGTYENKKKLILTGFHECAVAAYSVQKYLYPEVKQSVQYTTTSSALQTRLGVREK
jgi:thioredoxin reductase (NADPH)